MTVESNDAIATATLSDWFRNLAPVFQAMRGNTEIKPIAPHTRDVSRVLSKLQVIAGNSDRFIVPLWLVEVITSSELIYLTVVWKTLR